MRLQHTDMITKLSMQRFGVLATVDPDRAVHQVPVVFATDGTQLVVPIDAIKAKRSTRLRRIDNLTAEPRASLLVDHRSEDWEQLGWVRAELVFTQVGLPDGRWLEALRAKYPQYEPDGAIESVMHFEIARLAGWAAS
jgi:PPOX class probable F420-dependent enzyme